MIMTGDTIYRGRPVEDMAAEVGAVATFMKPFDLDALRQAVWGVVSPVEPAPRRSGAEPGSEPGAPERRLAPAASQQRPASGAIQEGREAGASSVAIGG